MKGERRKESKKYLKGREMEIGLAYCQVAEQKPLLPCLGDEKQGRC